MSDFEDDGYDRDDPKHVDWLDALIDALDPERGDR